MAKKAVAPAPQLVHIKTTAAEGLLTKTQKEFNRLSKKVVKLEQELHDFRAMAARMRQRAQTELIPLQRQYLKHRVETVQFFDEALAAHKLTKGEVNKLTDLLVNMSGMLIDKGFEELIPLFEKHSKEDFAQAGAEADLQASELMKALFSQQFGIEFDPAVDVSTQAKFEAYVAQQMALKQEGQQAAAEARKAASAQRPKTPRQQAAEARREAAEAKKRAEEKHATKSVRALYLDLVKALHPDREPDEAERLRKTELLKKVTVAYENNELLTLLRLQLQLNRLDQAQLENLAEDQLKHFVKLLREQARELEDTYYDEQVNYAESSGERSYFLPTVHSMAGQLQRQIRDIKELTKLIVKDLEAFRADPTALKEILKTYKKAPPASARRPIFMG